MGALLSSRSWFRPAAFVLAIVPLFLLTGSTRVPDKHSKAHYADPRVIDFVRPGLVVKVTGASIAADGTIQTTFLVTDPQGLPLDMAGVTTPGAISLSFVAATIPKGQSQYVAYTTVIQTSSITKKSDTQASADKGGKYTQTGEGIYVYQFATKAPSGFDASATQTIGIYGSRDLTSFGLDVSYVTTTYNFVPNGSPVTEVRDVVRTPSCDTCHDQLAAHGGSRRDVTLCVMCHTPQSTDPSSGNTLDFKVMVHKIHMGASLPSVLAGTPYQIIGYMNSVNDWSTVVYPADVRRCETCHSQTSGATQAANYMTQPSRAACGSCHDDVNFASGLNHPGGPQADDTHCSTCHIPQGEIDFDASVKGAHVVPTDSSLVSGVVASILNVSGAAGSGPTVSFNLTDKSGAALAPSQLDSLDLVLSGPTTDYGDTNFGSDVKTPGYVSESATKASCGTGGTCIYTFQHSIPSGATGTFAIGIEARRDETILTGTPKQQVVEFGAKNQVYYFSVDGSPVTPRRDVVEISQCNGCHVSLMAHGNLRNQTEMCVLCHNPSDTDAAVRATAQVASDKAQPPQGINFSLMVHRIHYGANMKAQGGSYTIVGYGGSHNDFSGIRYSAMNLQGTPGETRNCDLCHVKDSEQNFPIGLNNVVNPQGWINPEAPTSAACSGCHILKADASHFLSNTNSLGEACTVCHGADADFNIAKVHAQ